MKKYYLKVKSGKALDKENEIKNVYIHDNKGDLVEELNQSNI